MIDTHAHLDFPEFAGDLPQVIARAKDSGVSCLITVGTTLESSRKAIAIARQYPEVYAAVGIHPQHANEMTEPDWQAFEQLAEEDKVVAIGETGLDFHFKEGDKYYAPKDAQEKAFIRQLALAKKHDKPIILHSREAHPQCLKILKEVMGKEVKGVAHCFSGTADDARAYLDLGMYIAVGGPITFPNALQLKEALKSVPIERLLLETDCPFLAPQAKRGQRNEPAYLTYCLEEFARIYYLSVDDIKRITTLNANGLFDLDALSKPGEIAYAIRSSLYLNITNRCTAQCYFCVTRFTDYVKGHNLRLQKEPTADQIINTIPKDVVSRYKEVVFCGYGEPTLRLDIIKEVSGFLKKQGIAIRLNTNGHGNLIHNRSILPELKGLIDIVSISVNATDPAEYVKTCHPQFGEITFSKVIEFIKDAKEHLPYVEITTVIRPGLTVERFQDLAKELSVDFRARIYNEVG